MSYFFCILPNLTVVLSCRVSGCIQDIQLLHHVLTLVGVVPLKACSADLLMRCSDLLLEGVQRVMLYRHGCHREPKKDDAKEEKSAKVETAFENSRLPQFLFRAVSPLLLFIMFGSFAFLFFSLLWYCPTFQSIQPFTQPLTLSERYQKSYHRQLSLEPSL